jgi:hypothetical protein
MQTTLSPAQEALVVELRRTVLLSLDDLTAVTRAYIHLQASRAAIGRLLKREGVSRLADLMPKAEGEPAPKKSFKDYAPGYLHIDLKELPKMPDEAGKTYLCARLDRASQKWRPRQKRVPRLRGRVLGLQLGGGIRARTRDGVPFQGGIRPGRRRRRHPRGALQHDGGGMDRPAQLPAAA